MAYSSSSSSSIAVSQTPDADIDSDYDHCLQASHDSLSDSEGTTNETKDGRPLAFRPHLPPSHPAADETAGETASDDKTLRPTTPKKTPKEERRLHIIAIENAIDDMSVNARSLAEVSLTTGMAEDVLARRMATFGRMVVLIAQIRATDSALLQYPGGTRQLGWLESKEVMRDAMANFLLGKPMQHALREAEWDQQEKLRASRDLLYRDQGVYHNCDAPQCSEMW